MFILLKQGGGGLLGPLSFMFYLLTCSITPDLIVELHLVSHLSIQTRCAAEEKPLKHAGERPSRTRTEPPLNEKNAG